MVLALPGARFLFSKMKETLCHFKGKRVSLFKGVYEALADFRWLAEDVSNRPTHLYNLVPLRPTVNGYHKSSSNMCGDMVLPGQTSISRIFSPQPSTSRPSPNPIAAHPVVWRAHFPKYVVESLVSWTNPQGTVNKSIL